MSAAHFAAQSGPAAVAAADGPGVLPAWSVVLFHMHELCTTSS
jgi:hypothetical protein